MLGLLQLLFQAVGLLFVIGECLLLHLLKLLQKLGLELLGDPVFHLICVLGPLSLKLNNFLLLGILGAMELRLKLFLHFFLDSFYFICHFILELFNFLSFRLLHLRHCLLKLCAVLSVDPLSDFDLCLSHPLLDLGVN